MFTSIRDSEESSRDTSERLRFVSGWFRVLGFVLVAVWIVAGAGFVVVALKSPQPAFVILGVVGAAVGILITAPLYFWFAAIASGIADIVDHTRPRIANS